MQSRTAVATVVSLVVGIGLVAAGVAWAGQGSQTTPPRLITVTGTSTVSTAPDEAVITFGTRSQATQSQAAFDQNASKMSAILDAIARAGVEKKDVQTTDVGLERRTEGRGTPHEHTFYAASNQVQVTIRELDRVGPVIDAAVSAGVDQVRDIRFQLSDETAVRRDALRAAVQGARSKADAMADAAGASVVGVVSIREQGSGQPEPLYAGPQPFAALAGDQLTPIVPPHDIQTRVTVTATWSIG